MGKLKTPDWIVEGYDSKAEYEKAKGLNKKKSGSRSSKSGKVFKIRECPICHSDSVGVVLVGEEGKSNGEWECKKCKWQGVNVVEKELDEEEFMKYLDEKGEEVA